MSSLAIALAVLAAVAVLTAAHVVYWSRRLAAPTREDEELHAVTADGWRLAIGHRRPRSTPRLPPVLLVHGIAVNRQFMDFGVERYSLAAHLAAMGCDCFALDLRGHGGSRRRVATPRRGRAPTAPRRWNLDTYLREDVPAALDAVQAATGAERVVWVGHSQGALLGMAACALYPERISALVGIAGPAHFDAQPRLARLVRWRAVLGGRFLRPLARAVAPVGGVWHPEPVELAIHLRNVEPGVYRRMLANAIEDLQPGVLEQFAAFVREDAFRSMDGAIDYRALLPRCRQPALFLSAERDGLAPPPVVESAFRRWGGPKRYWNFGHGYGHSDLLLGRHAPEVVFPRIEDFLREVTRPAGAATAGRADDARA